LRRRLSGRAGANALKACRSHVNAATERTGLACVDRLRDPLGEHDRRGVVGIAIHASSNSTGRVGSSLRRLARTPPAEPPPTMTTSTSPARPLPISDMDLVLLRSMTRNRIVATRQVSCHRRIPVIQQATKNRGARAPTESSSTAGLRHSVFELRARRDVTSSLRHALRRWYSTVLALMKR
jgi:hypothetical protein